MSREPRSDRHAALESERINPRWPQPKDLHERLLAAGSMSGPHRRTRPLTVSKWTRLLRWLRNTFRRV